MAISAPSLAAGSAVQDEGFLAKSQERANAAKDISSTMLSSLMSTAITMFLTVSVSVFLYATFYFAYMPVEMVDMPVHLQFQPCDGHTANRCSFPTAALAVGQRTPLLQGQAYSIRLALEMPDSPSNEELGMFMACINITGKADESIDQSCRPSMAEYRSPLLRTMETVAFSPLLVLGLMRQSQKVAVQFFDNFHPDPHSVARAFHLQLKSRLVHVTRATLHVEASLTGLRYLMYRHSWISAIMGVGTNVFIILAIFTISWAGFRASNSEALELRNAEKTDDKEDDTEDTSDAAVEVEGERLEQETVEKAEEMAVPQAPSQSVGNKLKWFFIRFVFKTVLKAVKVMAVLTVAVMCYEVAVQGTEATRLTVLEAVKEDLRYVFQLASPLVNKLAVMLAKKAEDLARPYMA